MKSYAGIGSRKTPAEHLNLMRILGTTLASEGWVLRSGAAGGADAAFEQGCDLAGGAKEIYLPWRGFNAHPSCLAPSYEAEEMAAKFHPAWGSCSQGARKLHARNCHQVLGQNLDSPVEFVVCWTPNASGSGGTGQAIRVARHYGIPVFDLASADGWDQCAAFLRACR
jgi:hypothetical protein